MRFDRQIKRAIAHLFILLVFAAPVAATLGAHDCCPDLSDYTSARGVTAHLQHVQSESLEAAFEDHGAHYSSVDLPCDISCCANVLGSDVVNTGQSGVSSLFWHTEALTPANKIAASTVDNIHTPPPRRS